MGCVVRDIETRFVSRRALRNASSTMTGMGAYRGITTGRMTPGFVNTVWSPSVRTQARPSASKTAASRL